MLPNLKYLDGLDRDDNEAEGSSEGEDDLEGECDEGAKCEGRKSRRRIRESILAKFHARKWRSKVCTILSQ